MARIGVGGPMTLEHDLAGGGTTALVYRIYRRMLWPVGTFLAGVEGLGLVWPAIGAMPIFALTYGRYRRRQEKPVEAESPPDGTMMRLIGRGARARKVEKITKTELALALTLWVGVRLLGLYYAGAAVAYFWT